MYICSKCNKEVVVKTINKGKGFCGYCSSFSVDLNLSMYTKKYLDKIRTDKD